MTNYGEVGCKALQSRDILTGRGQVPVEEDSKGIKDTKSVLLLEGTKPMSKGRSIPASRGGGQPTHTLLGSGITRYYLQSVKRDE